MKKGMLALVLAGVLLLSSCSALLDRPYVVASPHPEHPAAGSDPSTLKASSYSELVSGVLYLVSQVLEEGSIQLVDYDGDVETDLNNACLEVAKDDPLGAYAVDFIKNEYTRVLTTYEAKIYITYRRTPEQIRSLVNVTGASAIRRVLQDALSGFQGEVALRVGYFTEDEAYIRTLVRQAYYDTPAAALGMPEYTVSLYPEEGSVRIVEIVLEYGNEAETLRLRSQELEQKAEALALSLLAGQPYGQKVQLDELLALLPEVVVYDPSPRPDGTLPKTAWDAIVGSGADDEGTALALQLLCDLLDLECVVEEGTLEGEPHFWNQVAGEAGEQLHLDLSRPEPPQAYTEEAFLELGYLWASANVPASGGDSGGSEVDPQSEGGTPEGDPAAALDADPTGLETKSESVGYEFP